MRFRTQSLLAMALFAALTAVGGFIRIPAPLVPFTMQTFFVYLAGSLLGSTRGMLSQCLFLGVGLLGVPVFAMGGGPAYVLQPSFGYLASFPLAAWTVGWWIEHRPSPRHWTGWMGIYGLGFMIIFILGVIYLWICFNYMLHKPISIWTALWSGMIIFMPSEIAKIFLSAIVTRRLRTQLNPMLVL